MSIHMEIVLIILKKSSKFFFLSLHILKLVIVQHNLEQKITILCVQQIL